MIVIFFSLFVVSFTSTDDIVYGMHVPLDISGDSESEIFIPIEINTFEYISNSEMRKDCSDLKIVDINMKPQRIWIESGCGSQFTTVVLQAKLPFSGYFLHDATTEGQDKNEHKMKILDDTQLHLFHLSDEEKCPYGFFIVENYERDEPILHGIDPSFDNPIDSYHDHKLDTAIFSGQTKTDDGSTYELKTSYSPAPYRRRRTYWYSVNVVDSGHDHDYKTDTIPSKVSSASIYPSFRKYALCQSFREFGDFQFGMDVPQNVTLMSTHLHPNREGYELCHQMDGKFVKLIKTNVFDERPDDTAGGMSHIHTVEEKIYTDSFSGEYEGGKSVIPQSSCVIDDHFHEVGLYALSDSTSTLSPPYGSSLFYKTNGEIDMSTRIRRKSGPSSSQSPYYIPYDGIIMLVDGEEYDSFVQQQEEEEGGGVIPGWSELDVFNNYYIRGSIVEFGGLYDVSSNHSHDVSVTIKKSEYVGGYTSDDVQCSYNYRSSSYASLRGHYHEYDYTSSNGGNHKATTGFSRADPPAARHLKLLVRNMNELVPDGTEIVFGDTPIENPWECHGVRKVDACNTPKGDCVSSDFCECVGNYYGKECRELVFDGFYGIGEIHDEDSDMFTIQVNYTVDVEMIWDELFYRGMTGWFDCSFMITEESIIDLEIDEEKCFSKGECCSWSMDTIQFTKYLLIDQVKPNRLSHIILLTVSDPKMGRINVTLKAWEKMSEMPLNDNNDNDKGVEDTVAVVISTTLFLLFVPISVVINCCLCCFCFFCLPVCCGLVVGLFIQKRRMKKYQKLKDLDLIMVEQDVTKKESDNTKSWNHLKINKRLFIVKYSDLKLEEKIGEGGSGSIVYLCKWKGRKVAFKCFKCSEVCDSERSFAGFEKEVSIIASVHHPFILQFFGATILPPRIGIVCEYCLYRDLTHFFSEENETGMGMSILGRVRFLVEISSSMLYLHNNKIIHRDLKSGNVLVTKFLETKLMDFGLSRYVERMSTTKTKRIGTLVYMAPEITRGESYSELCDVYSFSILAWEVLCKDFTPYGEDAQSTAGLEFKVASNPNFRPNLSSLPDDVVDWARDEFLCKCWSDEESERLSFEEINALLSGKFGRLKKEEKKRRLNGE